MVLSSILCMSSLGLGWLRFWYAGDVVCASTHSARYRGWRWVQTCGKRWSAEKMQRLFDVRRCYMINSWPDRESRLLDCQIDYGCVAGTGEIRRQVGEIRRHEQIRHLEIP